jgi:osmotically-inducible protein OsmY
VRSDEQLEAEIRRDVVVGTDWMPEESVDVTVTDGDVILEGSVETETVAQLIESQVRSVAGVVSVESRLEWPEGAGV